MFNITKWLTDKFTPMVQEALTLALKRAFTNVLGSSPQPYSAAQQASGEVLLEAPQEQLELPFLPGPEDKVSKAREMVDAGRKKEDIAQEFGVSVSTINRWLAKQTA